MRGLSRKPVLVPQPGTRYTLFATGNVVQVQALKGDHEEVTCRYVIDDVVTCVPAKVVGFSLYWFTWNAGAVVAPARPL